MNELGESLLAILKTSWAIWGEMAPWLIVGLIAAGLLKAWFPAQLVHKWLGKPGLMSALKAAVIGTPLPLCSCSVLPAAMQLNRSGASSSATVSFLVATPENGADSIAMSWALLGPWMTVLRVVAALISASVAGVLAGLLEQRSAPRSSNHHLNHSGMPSAQLAVLLPVIDPGLPSSSGLPTIPLQGVNQAIETTLAPCCQPRPCCSSNPGGTELGSDQLRWYQCLEYAFSGILSDIAHWVVIGVVTAAVIHQIFPADSLASWGRGPLVMLAVLAISVPTYVCATASTPIAASLLAAGMSPGTVLVFLLAGPASNFSSAAVVRRELGKPALVGYLFGVAGMSFLIGLAVDLLLPNFRPTGHFHNHEHNSLLPDWLTQAIGISLLLRIVWLWIAPRTALRKKAIAS